MAKPGPHYNPILTFWHQLYHHQTKQEQLLEIEVAKLAVRYRTQHPFRCGAKSYFADLWLPDYALVIEIDDPSHDRADKRKKDLERTIALQAKGLEVLRLTNEEADSPLMLHAFIQSLIKRINQRPFCQWHPDQSPEPCPAKPEQQETGTRDQLRKSWPNQRGRTSLHR